MASGSPTAQRKSEKGKTKTFDHLLEELGFGRWNVLILLQIGLMELCTGGISNVFVFMEFKPEHACAVPSLVNGTNWTITELVNATSPIDLKTGKRDTCRYVMRNYSDYEGLTFCEAFDRMPDRNETDHGALTGKCEHWVFDKDQMKETIVTQWDLLCDKAVQVANAQMVFYVGTLVGALLAGYLGDKFGRLIIVVTGSAGTALFGLAASLVPQFWLFIVFRFLVAITCNFVNNILYVIAMEYCTEKLRKSVAACIYIPWVCSTIVLGAVGYGVKDWRYLHILASVPLGLGVVCWWTLPESPRWLLAKGRKTQVRNILLNAARMNGKELDLDDTTDIVLQKDDDVTRSKEFDDRNTLTIWQLFKYPKLALRLSILAFIWFSVAFVYFGVSLIVSSFSGSLFLNNAISSFMDVPAYILSYPLLTWGRQKSEVVTFILAGVALLCYYPIPSHIHWLTITVSMIGKFSIAATFNIIWIYTAELFPTVMRSMALNMGGIWDRVGSTVAPYVNLIAQQNPSMLRIPMLIYGAVSILAGISTIFLPETANNPLPETLDDLLNYPNIKNRSDVETFTETSGLAVNSRSISYEKF